MDQLSNRSGVGSDDITDETGSLLDVQLSSDEDSSDALGPCLAVPQSPLPSYKQRVEEFKRLFKELPDSEILILDYPCALHRDILLQGRLYLSENWICFYSYVFRGTKIILSLKDITTMSREKTARLIPNAIQICTCTEKYFFASFSAREKSYQSVFRIWQNSLMDKTLTCPELWQMIKQHYGYDLGLNNEEMESLQVLTESTVQTSLQQKLISVADEGLGRPERPNSLRLPVVEHAPLQSSTPQPEEMPSPMSSPRTTNTDESRNSPSLHRSPTLPLERHLTERLSKRSTQSLDLNANENLLEQSGSDTNEEVEDRIDKSEEPGRLYLNKVFHMSASKMFELLFTDSSFTQRFMKIRRITNPSSTAWQKDDSGNNKRTLSYTITINNPLIGKFSTATENQTLSKESREGQYYQVDAVVHTHDVPYHDHFYTQNRYYIIRVSKRKCRLRVYSDVKYSKPTFGLIKTFITKNSWSGIEDYFRQLEAELLEEEAEINQAVGESGKAGLRRRRRTFSRTLLDHGKPGKQSGQDPEHRDGNMGPMDTTGPQRWSTTAIVVCMSVILLILMVLNLGLFFKLWAMEDTAHRMYLTTKHRLRQRMETSFGSQHGPKPLPGFRTNEDMQLLKTVLQDSILLLEQLRTSLVVLQQNFAMANQTATQQ
ncbi:GRAM domain-containing protein 1C [Poecilia reticulata]|uniref:GRAM domain containing 1C n=1 Tax=Poecilia reticulata TaxID=8081 RepID=A0A3P9Q1B5_POERE|nr:PREDICTED: GRAM domain-containing protein 1C [Poecilia reticulata]XP_008394544.1 PREDICTED: GRAM domain-containing protein 1C [Poecilia reticulata]